MLPVCLDATARTALAIRQVSWAIVADLVSQLTGPVS